MKESKTDISRHVPPFAHQDQDEREVAELLSYLKKTGDTTILDSIFHLDYDDIPVTPEEFLNSRHFMGPFAEALYPKWKEELLFVLDPANVINEWILYGSIGTGKTSAACVAQLYKLYQLTCMKSPQKLFGLAEHFPVYFAFFSITKEKAGDAINAKFQGMLNMSPYFRERLEKNARKVFLQGAANLFGVGYREHPKKDDLFELVLPHNLHLLFGSQTQHALSLDVFSATLDEMNFRAKKSIREEEDENSAQALYHQVRTRIESRFINTGYNPGLVINISSARSSDSFVEQRIKEVRDKETANVRISDFALWDVKPGRYGDKFFKIFVGSGFRSSRILEKEEIVDELREGEQIISVPEAFRDSFESGLDAAVRDLAGVATAALNKLFKRREIIKSANGKYANPIQPETIEVGLQDTLEISDFFDADLAGRYNNMERILMNHPRAGRFVHVDLARRGDCVGISSICIPYYYTKSIAHTDSNKESVTLKLPFVFVDFFCRIKAPKMDEIAFEKVRQFIVWLRDSLNYPIVRVSYDSWQSIHSMQLLMENGFETETISVDRTDEPYMELLNCFVEKRIMKPPYEVVDQELKELEHDISMAKGAVDHPRSGSKDVADSLAGAYANALGWIHKNGFGAIGSHLVQESILPQLWAKHPSELKAIKLSKEMGYDEPVRLESGYDGKFYGVSRLAKR